MTKSLAAATSLPPELLLAEFEESADAWRTALLERTKQLLQFIWIPLFTIFAAGFRETWAVAGFILCSAILVVTCTRYSVRIKGLSVISLGVGMWTALAFTNSEFKNLWMIPMFLAPVLAGALHGAKAAAGTLLATSTTYGLLLALHLAGYTSSVGLTIHSGTTLWIVQAIVSGITCAIHYLLFHTLTWRIRLSYIERHFLYPLTALQEEMSKKQRALKTLQETVTMMTEALAHYSHGAFVIPNCQQDLTFLFAAIRTPLNVLCAASEILQTVAAPSDPNAAMLQYAAQSLLALANTVLDILALELHALYVRQHTFNLHSAVRLVFVNAAAAAEIKGLKFVYSLDENVPQYVIGDPTRFQQILRNFFEIVLRRAGDGTISAQVGCRAPAAAASNGVDSAPAAKLISFTLTVNRPGSNTTAAPLSMSRSSPSVIDRSIAHKLLAALGGWEEPCESGAALCIIVPLTQVSDIPAGAADSMTPLSILYADDIATNRYVMEAMVRHTAHTLTTVTSGADAVYEYCHSGHHYDLIILDYQMPPGITGVEAARQIRAYEASRPHGESNRVPLALLTAYAGSDLSREEVSEFDYGVMSKPLRRARLAELTEAVHWARVRAKETKTAAAALTDAVAMMTGSARYQQPQVAATSTTQEETLLSAICDKLAVFELIAMNNQAQNHSTAERVRKIIGGEHLPFVMQWKVYCLAAMTALQLFLVLVFALYPPLLQPLLVDMRASVGLFFIWLGLSLLVRLSTRTAAVAFAAIAGGTYAIYVVRATGFVPSGILSCIFPLLMILAGASVVEVGFAVAAIIIAVLALCSHGDVVANSLTMDLAWSLYCTVVSGLQAWYILSMRSTHLLRLVEWAHTVQLATELNLLQGQSLERFLAAMSFDFRSPLNVVLGVGHHYANQLDNETSDTKGQVVAMESAAHMLRTLLDTMLYERSRSLGQKVSLQVIPINLFNTIADIARLCLFHARSNRHEVCLRWADSVPLIAAADPKIVQYTLTCMTQHALQCAPPAAADRSCTLIVAVDAVSSLNSTVLRNTTPPADSECSMFCSKDLEQYGLLATQPQVRMRPSTDSPFFVLRVRVSWAVHDDLPSEPLVSTDWNRSCFAVARYLALQAGGYLMRSSGPCLSFTCVLPLQVPSAPTIGDALQPHISWPRPLHVVIVDDAPEMQFVLGLYLRDTPHRVSVASTAQQLLDLWAQTEVDAIVLDVSLPDKSGLEVARTIRASGERGARVFILCVTAAAMPDDQERAMEAGVSVFEAKPIARERFLQHLYRVAQESTRRPTTPLPDGIDVDRLTVQLASCALRQHAASQALSAADSTAATAVDPSEKWTVAVPAPAFEFVRSKLVPQLRFQVTDMLAAVQRQEELLRSQSHSPAPAPHPQSEQQQEQDQRTQLPEQQPQDQQQQPTLQHSTGQNLRPVMLPAVPQLVREWADRTQAVAAFYGLQRTERIARRLLDAQARDVPMLLDHMALALESLTVVSDDSGAAGGGGE